MLDVLLMSVFLSAPAVKAEIECLASVVYHEARGESVQGQLAVAQVVLNRVKSGSFPDSICKVAFQRAQFSGLHHIKFSEQSLWVARASFAQLVKSKIKHATHYHTKKVNPTWNRWSKLKREGVVGNHIFYRRKV